jgi:MFS family permease
MRLAEPSSGILEMAATEKQARFYGWSVLFTAFVLLVLGYAIRNTFSVFYPVIVREFGWGRGDTALMFSIGLIVYGGIAPIAGGLVDRFEPRLVLSIGAGVLGGGIALCSLATAHWHFYLLYGIVVAAGLCVTGWTPLTAIVSNWFLEKRGLAFGILGAGFGGSLVMAPVAQFLINALGWQKAYLVMGFSCAAIMVPLTILFIRRSPEHMGFQSDRRLHTTYKIDGATDRSAGAVIDKTQPNEWSLARALRTHQFWLLFSIAFCLLGFAEQIAIAHQVYFFLDVGYEPMIAAAFYSVFGVTFVVGNLCSAVSDRWGRVEVFIPSCLLCAAAAGLLFWIADAAHPWMPVLFSVAFGLGLGTAAPVFFATVADRFHGRSFGAIQGTVVLGFSLGGAIAPSLAGFLHDLTGTYFATFLILIGAMLASAICMWFAAPRKADGTVTALSET